MADRMFYEKLKEMIFPVLFILLGIYITIMSFHYEIGGLDEPKAGLFPLIVGLGLIAINAATCFRIARGNAGGEANPETRDGETNSRKEEAVKYVCVLIALLLWPILLPTLGYLVMTFLVAWMMAKILGMKGWLNPAILSLSVSVAVYVLFKKWFYLDFPNGKLIDWLISALWG